MLLCCCEGQLIVTKYVIWVKTVVIDQLRTEVMDDGTESQPIPPTGGHVEDVDIAVVLSDPLAPGLQGLGALQSHDK